MKEIKQCIVLVDYHTPLHFKHNTEGSYKVGAKTKKEAVQLVRNAIGFGHVQFYQFDESNKNMVAYKEIKKYNRKIKQYEPARHANDNMKKL